MKKLDIDQKIGDLVAEHPEVLDTLVDLGFTHLKNPAMLASVGKIMTIRKAAKNHKLPLNDINQALNQIGYEIEGETE